MALHYNNSVLRLERRSKSDFSCMASFQCSVEKSVAIDFEATNLCLFIAKNSEWSYHKDTSHIESLTNLFVAPEHVDLM